MTATHPRAGDPPDAVTEIGRLLVVTVHGKIAGVGVVGEDGDVLVSTAASDAAYDARKLEIRLEYQRRRRERTTPKPPRPRTADGRRFISRAAAAKL